MHLITLYEINCRKRDLNPHSNRIEQAPEACASANSAIPAFWTLSRQQKELYFISHAASILFLSLFSHFSNVRSRRLDARYTSYEPPQRQHFLPPSNNFVGIRSIPPAKIMTSARLKTAFEGFPSPSPILRKSVTLSLVQRS